MMALKAQKNDTAVDAFLAAVEPLRRKEDAIILKAMMERITGWPARMCGKTIVGFGSYAYKYANGQTGSALVVGYAPRKASLVLYIMNGFQEYEELLAQLGKYKTGKCCLYINKLADVEEPILEKIIQHSVVYMKEKYSC